VLLVDVGAFIAAVHSHRTYKYEALGRAYGIKSLTQTACATVVHLVEYFAFGIVGRDEMSGTGAVQYGVVVPLKCRYFMAEVNAYVALGTAP
jgi:hypothetical protein